METLIMTLLTASPATDGSFLREYAETRRYLSGRPVSVKVTPDGKSAFFLRSGARDPRQMLFELELATGSVKEVLTPDAVLKGTSESLSVAEKARLERMRVSARGFTSYQLSADGTKLLVGLSGKPWLVERASLKVTELKIGEGGVLDPRFSPDGKLVAYVRDNDVHVIDLAKNVEKRVTKGGTEKKPHGLAEFVAQEEMSRFVGYWFSPDAKFLAFQETDHTGMEVFGIADPMHPERAADQFFYPRAGKMNATVKLGINALAGGATTWVTWDAVAFPYLASVVWKDGPLTLVVQNREQTKEQVLSVDPKTGKTTVLLTEEDEAWVNLDQSFPLWWKDVGFFWRTERNGAVEIELRKPDGTLAASWVKPGAGFNLLSGFDAATRTLYFTGGPNPTRSQVFKVVDGAAPEVIAVKGQSVLATLTGDAKFLATNAESLDAMATASVFELATQKVSPVPSVAAEPKFKPNAEVLQLPDDGPWAMVLRPQNFTKGKKYPVILQVYGGPHHLEVNHAMRENLLLQWFADQGFVVVKLDGRGTPRRTRAYERAIARDFATTTMADQLSGLSALGKKFPELDLTRVGVYGWSFGGYMASLLTLAKGDAFKSGVAGAPVVDWLDYDTFYTERYLGLPDAQPRAYEVSSVLSYVKDSKRPLLLIHGTADDNVYFLHSLKLSDALFRAGKPHSVLPLINFTHMVADPVVTERLYERVATWFKETL